MIVDVHTHIPTHMDTIPNDDIKEDSQMMADGRNIQAIIRIAAAAAAAAAARGQQPAASSQQPSASSQQHHLEHELQHL